MIILALCAGAASSLTAATLFSFGGDGFGIPRNFTAINASTGTASSQFLLGDGSVAYSGGLAYRSSDSTFFAIANDSFGNSSLVNFTTSGAASLSTPVALGTGFLGGLAFNSADQRFYAIANDFFGNSTLHSFGADGVIVASRSIGMGFYGSLTYNASDGLLYAIGSDLFGVQRVLYSIDPLGAGIANPLFSLGDGSLDFGAGLAWDPVNSRFYALGFDGWNPFSLVTFPGGANTLSTVGTLTPVSFRGLVLADAEPGGEPAPVPEPATGATLAVALLGLALLRRK